LLPSPGGCIIVRTMLQGFSCRFLTVAAGLFAAALGTATAGSAAVADRAAVPVRLLSPADGAVLMAGTTATLDWMPLAHLAQKKDWEEWEAFLSVDGGATYPVRITPHLDRDVRRITFKVPSLPTRYVRLLLRAGDERREQVYELPQRFSIKTVPGVSGTAGSAAPPRRVWRRGESARPGERGVLVWVEGSRRGGQLREVVAEEPARAEPAFSLSAGSPAPTAVAAATPPSGAPGSEPEVRSTAPPSRNASAVRIQTPRLGGVDILLLIQRQNE
jgi:hypothetical protein